MERFSSNNSFSFMWKEFQCYKINQGIIRTFETRLHHFLGILVLVFCFVKYLTFLPYVQGMPVLLRFFDTVLSGAQLRYIRSFWDLDNSLLSNSIHGLISSSYRTDVSAKG